MPGFTHREKEAGGKSKKHGRPKARESRPRKRSKEAIGRAAEPRVERMMRPPRENVVAAVPRLSKGKGKLNEKGGGCKSKPQQATGAEQPAIPPRILEA